MAVGHRRVGVTLHARSPSLTPSPTLPLSGGGRKRRPRDYYRIEDEDGRRYWVFREGLYQESELGSRRLVSARRVRVRSFAMTRYAELDVTTNFTFLRGGSHAEELVATAKALGLDAIAVTDRNTLAGVVRAHLAAKEVGIKFIVGARLDLLDAPSLLAYPRDRAAYGRLCRLLTLGQRRAEKGQCTLYLDDVAAHAEGLIFIALPPEDFPARKGRRRARSIADAPLAAEGVMSISWNMQLNLSSMPSPARGEGAAASHHNFEAQLRRIKQALGGTSSTSRRGILIAATIAPASPRLPISPRASAFPSSPPAACSITRRIAALCRTCSPASARNARSTTRACASRPMPSGTSSRPQEMARLFAGHEDALAPHASRSPTPAPSPSTS